MTELTEPTSFSLLINRLERIEDALRVLMQQKIIQQFYSTADAARVLGKAEFTVREWCRHGRVQATKRASGRGRSLEWMIPHEELQRVQSEGLLPLKH